VTIVLILFFMQQPPFDRPCPFTPHRCRADRGLNQAQRGLRRSPPVRLCRHRQDHAPSTSRASAARSCSPLSPARPPDAQQGLPPRPPSQPDLRRASGERRPADLWHGPGLQAAIVIDRCSMVDAELARDRCRSACRSRYSAVAQLPPIQGGGFFTDAKPDAMLTGAPPGTGRSDRPPLHGDPCRNSLAEGQYGETQVVRGASTPSAC
jgi:hypothetical protein